jgi:galactokinase
MDQAVSLLAEPATALLLDCATLQTRHVPFDPAAADLVLLVIDTHVRHAHASGGYAQRRRECEQAAEMLGVAALRDAGLGDLGALPDVLQRRVRHVVTENARVCDAVQLLEAGDLPGLGPLFVQSHASLRDDFEVSVAELDIAVGAAVDAGAYGARMTGGGFGGAAIALVPTADVAAVTDAVRNAFAAQERRPPAVFAVRPAGGAERMEVP